MRDMRDAVCYGKISQRYGIFRYRVLELGIYSDCDRRYLGLKVMEYGICHPLLMVPEIMLLV